ncbi:YaaA family protein [Leekyejoonella antrihumi]|uniref:Peroxide stress protein YaaA n=1 Tax=Leekyejoonella antrihumi TaxID=1660198 RepID=A0A563E1P2_9MICO|nr:peroxide stress protein YaaA [Leekyejoonella antrihumi]TWP36325.1 peroxide stress protein YaaA [Leekyejoonella antrihumi]
MLILLPPSETKSGRTRGRRLDLDSLQWPELTPVRAAVMTALARASARPDAASTLGVSPNLTAEIARNVALETAPAVPVSQLYTGVLYDALGLATLDAAAKRRAARWIVVQSALFGALHLHDKVPPYRLSMAVNLPGLGPLAGVWRAPLASVMAAEAGDGVIVDCRSSTYAAAWTPSGKLADRWVLVKVPGATHMAKHTRGLVTRHLAEHGSRARTPAHLEAEVSAGFQTSLAAPVRTGQPWVLNVQAP